jgi:hypothetical protein
MDAFEPGGVLALRAQIISFLRVPSLDTLRTAHHIALYALQWLPCN